MTIKTDEPKRRVDLDQEIVKETHIVTVMTQSQKWAEVEEVEAMNMIIEFNTVTKEHTVKEMRRQMVILGIVDIRLGLHIKVIDIVNSMIIAGLIDLKELTIKITSDIHIKNITKDQIDITTTLDLKIVDMIEILPSHAAMMIQDPEKNIHMMTVMDRKEAKGIHTIIDLSHTVNAMVMTIEFTKHILQNAMVIEIIKTDIGDE